MSDSLSWILVSATNEYCDLRQGTLPSNVISYKKKKLEISTSECCENEIGNACEKF